MQRFLLGTTILVTSLALASCGTLTGIPGHGGGKRFVEEQRLVSASVRGSLEAIDISMLRGKRVALIFSLISDEGAGNIVGGRASLSAILTGGTMFSPVSTTNNALEVYTLANAGAASANTISSGSGSNQSQVIIAGTTTNTGTSNSSGTNSGSNTNTTNGSGTNTNTVNGTNTGSSSSNSTTDPVTTTSSGTNSSNGTSGSNTGAVTNSQTSTTNGNSNTTTTTGGTTTTQDGTSGSTSNGSSTNGASSTTGASNTNGSNSSTTTTGQTVTNQTGSNSGSNTNTSNGSSTSNSTSSGTNSGATTGTNTSSGSGTNDSSQNGTGSETSNETSDQTSNSSGTQEQVVVTGSTQQTAGRQETRNASLEYKGLGNYEVLGVPKSDSSLLMSLTRNYFILNNINVTTPQDPTAEAIVYVTVDIFGTDRKRTDLIVYNNERLSAETSIEMFAADRGGNIIMRPTVGNIRTDYREDYILWAGPFDTQRSVGEGLGLLNDFTDQ